MMSIVIRSVQLLILQIQRRQIYAPKVHLFSPVAKACTCQVLRGSSSLQGDGNFPSDIFPPFPPIFAEFDSPYLALVALFIALLAAVQFSSLAAFSLLLVVNARMPIALHLDSSLIRAESANQNLICEHRVLTHFENGIKAVSFNHTSPRGNPFKLGSAKSEFSGKPIVGSNDRLNGELGLDGLVPRNYGGNGGNGGGGGGGDGEGGDDEEEFGPILKYVEVMKEAEKKGVTLPADMVEAAKTLGIRQVFLIRYLELQGSTWPLGFLMRHCSMLRDRMLADPSFLFKVGTEIVIDSCCATFAEIQKRGKDFWSEFELYAADLLVGIVVDIALVGMLAPYARIGKRPVSTGGLLGSIQHACQSLPSSVFEAERPGCKFTLNQRIATYFYKGVLYGSVGFGCGLIGQGIANLIMTAKRTIRKSEEDIPVPPLVQSAALWGFFLAVSSNTRYQIINGLERVVEASPIARQFPPVAMAFTVGVRFANNVYGGMQFVDWAKLSGVQ